jgi:hypothetical protein
VVRTLLSAILLFQDFDAERTRANLKAGAVCGEVVDFKMNLVLFDREIDDAALRAEPRAFADRQALIPCRSCKIRSDWFFSVTLDKYNVPYAQFVVWCPGSDLDRMVPHFARP